MYFQLKIRFDISITNLNPVFRHKLYMKFIPTYLLVTIILLSACIKDEAQTEFERDAYQSPSGITQTTAQGEIVSEDPDDWRTAPYFQGVVEVNPPFQNPAQLGTLIEFELLIQGIQGISGLDVRVNNLNSSTRTIYSSFEGEIEQQLYDFRVNPIDLSQDGSDNLARGLHRIFFFDFNGRLITYGDIEVE